MALALIATITGVFIINSGLARAQGFQLNVFKEFTEALEAKEKTWSFIDKHGIHVFWSYLMCMEAAELERENKTSALTDNYEHKLKWMDSIRDIAYERNRLNPNESDLLQKELDIVNNVINSAKSICPDLR